MSRSDPLDLTDDEEECHESSSDDEDTLENFSLGLSESLAKANLSYAGSLVEESSEKITIAGNKDIFSNEVDVTLERVLNTLDLPYELAEFQRVSINVLGKKYNHTFFGGEGGAFLFVIPK